MITSKFEEADMVSKLNVGVRSHIDELLHVYVKIMLDNDELLPSYATEESACMDIRSNEDIIIKPGHTCLVSTGIHTEIPKGYVALVFPRSGLSIKQGGSLANCVGVIDSDFYNNSTNEGHFSFTLYNSSDKTYHVLKGEAFGQGIFQKFLTVDHEAEIKQERTYGFGSTNKEE